MGNSPSSPGQADSGTTNNSSNSGSSGKNSSAASSKQPASASGSGSGTGTGNTGAVSGPARGSHSNIPISPSLAQQQQQQQQQQQHQQQQQQQQQPSRPGSSPFIPAAQPRPPPPGIHPQARPQQQQRPVSQYVPTPYLQHLQNRPIQPRPPQPTSQRPPQRIAHQASQPPDAAAEDEIPTIVLQEQMESMLIDIATTESRVRELREELDTFESHPIFSSMMLAWFLSFNPGDYSIHRLEDLKRDALKAWQPVLSTFVQDSSDGGAQGQNLTEIEVRLFDSIIHDVISHANMIAGSTLDPEQLIQNLIQVAHSELEKARRTLEESRNAFQECQLMLQSRGVIPTSVLEMQRQIEEEQKKEQEARRANEQRQKEMVAQKQRERQRKRELEEQERQREREQEERRLLELEEQRKQEARQKAHEEEQEQQRKLEALRLKQEQLWKRMEARPARPFSSAIGVASASHTAKASSVSSPISLPGYNSAFTKRVHPESSEAFGVNITEEETLVTDQDSYEAHFAAPPIHTVEQSDEELLATPLLRRQKPISGTSETSSAEPAMAAHQLSYPPPSPGVASRIAHPMQMPMPMPFIPDYKQHQFAANSDHTQGQGQGIMQTQETPHSIPEHVPALYPPQIISEQDLQERLAQEQLEKLKRQNQEMERKIFLGQEQQRLHALTIQSIEMQGGVVPQGYPPYSHMGGVGSSHEPSQEEYRDHTQSMHSQQSSHGLYPPYGQQQGFLQQQQQQHPGAQHQHQQQQGYQIYPSDSSLGQYNGPIGNGQEQTSSRGDMYNYQSYGGYNNHTGSNWGPQQQQHQTGYLHHHQQQPHHGYSSSMTPAQQQQLQQQYQQQQLQQQQQQQHQHQHQHQHHQQFQQHPSPGQQTASGYNMSHSHGNVTYSVSPYGQEYDFGPAPMADSATGEAVASTATVDAEPTAEDVNSTDVSLPENDTRSPAVLPQIRANPVKAPIKRGPQAILSDEQREAAAQALRDAEEDTQETEGLASSSQPCVPNAEAEVEAEADVVPETDAEAGNSEEGRIVKQEDAVTDASTARSLDKDLPPTPPVNGDLTQGEEDGDDTKAKEATEESEETKLKQEEEDEDEEEEEVLQRSVRKMRIRPTTPLAPAISTPAASSVSPPSQVGNRVGSVFAPFPPRAAPRPAPRPMPRESLNSSNGDDRNGTAAAGQPTLAAPSKTSDSSVEKTTSTVTSSPSRPKSSASTESIRRLSMLKRTPSVPPVIPKKPAALRSPRSPTSEEQAGTV